MMGLSFGVEFEKLDGTMIRGSGEAIRLPAGIGGTWILRVGVGARGLPAGSRIVMQRYNIQIAHRLQADHPARRDWVTAESAGSTTIALDVGAGPGDKEIVLGLPEGIRKGEEIVVRVGDRRRGGPGSEVFWTTTTGRLHVTAEGPEGKELCDAVDYSIHVTSRGRPARSLKSDHA